MQGQQQQKKERVRKKIYTNKNNAEQSTLFCDFRSTVLSSDDGCKLNQKLGLDVRPD